MSVQKDLFGEPIKEDKPKKNIRLRKGLKKYDEETLEERLERLIFLRKIWPQNLLISGEMEFVFTLGEIKDCFIKGHFIAVIVLTQSFIEKIFVDFFIEKGFSKETKYGLDNMIKFAKKTNLIETYVLKKVDKLRQIRNPIIHSKDFSYEYSLSKRVYDNKIAPNILLENDAKDALTILTYILKVPNIGN